MVPRSHARLVFWAPVILMMMAALAFLGLDAWRDQRFAAYAHSIREVAFPEGRVAVEPAVTPEERRRGLAGRENLPSDSGMLFIYRDTAPRTFTMSGMRFDLDLMSLDESGRVTGVVTGRPGDGEFVLAPARYVLEVTAGWAAAHGVEIGTEAVLIIDESQ